MSCQKVRAFYFINPLILDDPLINSIFISHFCKVNIVTRMTNNSLVPFTIYLNYLFVTASSKMLRGIRILHSFTFSRNREQHYLLLYL